MNERKLWLVLWVIGTVVVATACSLLVFYLLTHG